MCVCVCVCVCVGGGGGGDRKGISEFDRKHGNEQVSLISGLALQRKQVALLPGLVWWFCDLLVLCNTSFFFVFCFSF